MKIINTTGAILLAATLFTGCATISDAQIKAVSDRIGNLLIHGFIFSKKKAAFAAF